MPGPALRRSIRILMVLGFPELNPGALTLLASTGNIPLQCVDGHAGDPVVVLSSVPDAAGASGNF